VRSGEFCGEIAPDSLPAWQASYRAFALEAAALAAQGAELFVVGTELASMSTAQYADYWVSLIAEARESFDGLITYAANHDEYQDLPASIIGALDLVGVDAYFQLPAGSCPSVSALVGAWRPPVDDLARWQASHGKPVLITEVGYPSTVGCGEAPWRQDPEAAYSECYQARAFQAASDAIGWQPWLAGSLVWHWDPHPPHPSARIRAYSPQYKLGQDVLAEVWAGLPGAGEDESLFGFERGAMCFVPQTYVDSRGITEVAASRGPASAGVGALRLDCGLVGGHPNLSKGEAFVDLRYIGIAETEGQPLDLSGSRVTAKAYCPAGSLGDPSHPNGLVLWAKSAPGGASKYGSWQNVQEGQWIALELTLDKADPVDGWLDPLFEPAAIELVGVKVGVGGASSAQYAGPIYLDELRIEGLPR